MRQMVFLKKILILDYREVFKRDFFDFFILSSTAAIKNFLIFCVSVDDNRAHSFKLDNFSEKGSIWLQ